MPLEPDFLEDCPYLEEGLFVDEILSIDRGSGAVVARMLTSHDLPLTNYQRVDPVLHPAHVNAGLMVHVAGMVAFIHAFHVLGLRHKEGWSAYGVRIRHAKYPALARIGPPIIIYCEPGRVLRRGDKIAVPYSFRFEQEGEVVFRSEQTAMYLKP